MDNQKNILNEVEKKNTNKKEKKIENLNINLIENQKKLYDLNLRHLANIENIKKNAEIEIQNIKNIKTENFFKKIIPIIDSLEETLILAKKLNITEKSLIQGIKLTLKSLINIICKFGVKIEGHKDELFNPKKHDVIEIQISNTVKPNHIIFVQRKGFTFNQILLRKATVIISKN